MAITFDDVLSAFPEADEFDPKEAKAAVLAANVGLPDSRFASPVLANRGRVLYVMHMLTKPGVDINAPHIRAQMGSPKPFRKKPHVWSGTEHGETLRKLSISN